MSNKIYYKDGFIFVVSKNLKKKYDVYDGKSGKYITSFGSRFHAQYKDRIGAFKNMDHASELRRIRYHKRHKNDYNEYPYSSYFSSLYLW